MPAMEVVATQKRVVVMDHEKGTRDVSEVEDPMQVREQVVLRRDVSGRSLMCMDDGDGGQDYTVMCMHYGARDCKTSAWEHDVSHDTNAKGPQVNQAEWALIILGSPETQCGLNA
jgi:hypothetical protein